MTRPLVSILIPVYNARRWLAAAFESALAQTWRQIEIIAVDDGSTDGSYDLARQFSGPRVLVLPQAHCGASAARNLAYTRAQGEFIQYLDADDMLGSGKIEAHFHVLASSENNMLSFGSVTHFFDSPPRNPRFHSAQAGECDGEPGEFLARLWDGSGTCEMVQTAQWLTPRRLIERAGSWNETLTVDDDGEFFARVILSASRIVAIPEAQSYYRKFRSQDSLSGSINHHDAMRAAQAKCLALLGHADHEWARRAVRKVITREIVRAFPAEPLVANSGHDFLRWHGLTMADIAEGSPVFRKIEWLLGWKAARWFQHHYRHWKARVRAPNGPRADRLLSVPPPEEDCPHPRPPPLPAGHYNPPRASVRPRA